MAALEDGVLGQNCSLTHSSEGVRRSRLPLFTLTCAMKSQMDIASAR